MTCRELLRRFIEALEKNEVDKETFRKLRNKCGAFADEALKALAKKVALVAMSRAWAIYRGAVIAERDPARAFGYAVDYVWHIVNWFNKPCHFLSELIAYTAEAAARYRWPSRWPLVAPAAVAAEENGCELPEAVAEALGADEYAKLESFLEQGEAVVEVAPGLKVALIRDGRYVVMVV
ncbi:MAG: hypothetical protein ACO2PN_21215 [Pyrobaculum sp.]|jgi:hypothetical protein